MKAAASNQSQTTVSATFAPPLAKANAAARLIPEFPPRNQGNFAIETIHNIAPEIYSRYPY